MPTSASWPARVAAVWAQSEQLGDADLLSRIDSLVAERPADDPAAVFEAASVRDFVGREADAEQLYARALALGLEEPLRGQAVIQLASSLRNLGRADEAVVLLREFFSDQPEHPLGDAAIAFLALALVSTGEATAATAVALEALSRHLPQYGNAVRRYALDL